MAGDLLVTAPPVEAGERLVRALKQSDFPMKAAGWIADIDGWRLYFVVKRGQPDNVRLYVAVAYKLEEALGPGYRDLSYKIVSEDSPLGRALLSWAGATGPAYRRVSGPVGTEAYISDAYVYGLAA